jgi:hypothetical protein
MKNSISIARIVGPTLIVMVSSELEFWNPTLYDAQITPLVYLSGVLMFVAGLSIVNKHNIWCWKWETLVTFIGYFAILLGLLRMFFPQTYSKNFKNDSTALYIEIILIIIGLFLTYKGYSSNKIKEKQ